MARRDGIPSDPSGFSRRALGVAEVLEKPVRASGLGAALHRWVGGAA